VSDVLHQFTWTSLRWGRIKTFGIDDRSLYDVVSWVFQQLVGNGMEFEAMQCYNHNISEKNVNWNPLFSTIYRLILVGCAFCIIRQATSTQKFPMCSRCTPNPLLRSVEQAIAKVASYADSNIFKYRNLDFHICLCGRSFSDQKGYIYRSSKVHLYEHVWAWYSW
jgi:hypothetical protein